MSKQSDEMARYFAANGIKNRQIAEKLGISEQTVSNMLKGRDSLGGKRCAQLAEAYGFDMQYSTNYGNVALRKIATREGLPPVTCYWARHTLASLLFEQGGTMDIVSAILSHSLGGARVTSTYVAVREARLDEAMRSVIDAVVR